MVSLSNTVAAVCQNCAAGGNQQDVCQRARHRLCSVRPPLPRHHRPPAERPGHQQNHGVRPSLTTHALIYEEFSSYFPELYLNIVTTWNPLIRFVLCRCVELIINQQMSKYKAHLRDISSLEFAEGKAKSRLTHIGRSMVRSELTQLKNQANILKFSSIF